MSKSINEDSNNSKRYVAHDFNHYLKIIEEIKSKEKIKSKESLWFRGQSNASYKLIPSAMRELFEIEDQFGRPIPVSREVNKLMHKGSKVAYISTKNMLEDFKEIAEFYLDIIPKNDFEWSFVAQHYGIPTKLMDWTTDPLTSLFFSLPKDISNCEILPIKEIIKAFDEDPFSDLGAAVFALNPSKINYITTGENNELTEPIDVNLHYESIKGYIHNYQGVQFNYPICILGSLENERISSQSANFIIHGNYVSSLEYHDVLREEIYKILIPYECIEEMKESLTNLGITKESLYGDTSLDKKLIKVSRDEEQKFYNSISKLIKKYED